MMIRFTVFVCMAFLLNLMPTVSNAQFTDPSTYDLQLTNAVVDCVSPTNTVCVDLQIKAATGAPDFVIGAHTVFLSSTLSTGVNIDSGVYTSAEFDENTNCGGFPPYLAPATSYDGNSGDINLTTNSNLSGALPASFKCPVISADWVTMGTFCFDLTTESGTLNLSFDTGLTLINDSNNSPEHAQGTLSPIVFPFNCGVTASCDPGTPAVSDDFVCWTETLNLSTTGYTLSDPTTDYVGLIVSQNNAISTYGDFIANAPYNLAQGVDNTSRTNGPPSGSGLPQNTDLYLYSFTAEGSAGSLSAANNECFQLSAPVGPFVVLQEIATSQSAYACNNDGTGLVNVVAAGGVPAYNGSNFTITTTNATVNGGATTAANNETLTLSVTDGLEWSVTFTDNEGCAVTITDTFTEAATCPCTADAGTASVNNTTFCYDASSIINVLATGYTLDADEPNSCIAVVISAESNISSIADFSSATNYLVEQADNATVTHGPPTGSGFPTNTNLYVYSAIGVCTGSVFGLASDCFDISAPAGPFVVLNPIAINQADGGDFSYDCNADGNSATVTLTANGGVPAFNGAENFTVSVSGTTVPYAGAVNIAEGGSITFTVTDGDAWTASFTDSEGCTNSVSDTFDATPCPNTTCAADAGIPSISAPFICWNDDIDFSIAGFDLQGTIDGYMGFAVSTSNAGGSDITAIAPNGLYEATASNDFSITNDAATLGVNVEFYLYSYVGSGDAPPNSFDVNCTDLSDAVGPFVLFQEILTSTTDYVCNPDGSAEVAVVASGAYPAFDATETFTVSVSNATYTGATNVANNEQIQFTVSDGANWEVTFTDSQGCSEMVSGTYIQADNCDVCTADAGNITVDKTFVCWNEDVTFSVADAVIDDPVDGYLGVSISPVAGITDINTFTAPTTTKYTLVDVSATNEITYTNNNTSFPTNTELFAYSFIGEGSQATGQINVFCSDIDGVGPVVALTEVGVNGDNTFTYNCNGDGTATVSLTPTGGLPAYDPTESFTIDLGNVTYTGPSTVANNTPISVTVADGASWSVNFTDAQGCTVSIGETFDNTSECGAVCTANAGSTAVSSSFVCFNNTIDFSTTGYTLTDAPDSYIAMAVSASAAGAANVGALPVAEVFVGDNATYTNDGTLVYNQPLYLYSFVGSGTPNNFDPSCTDLSDAAGSFVLLQEVTTAQSDYVCNNDGTANINVAVGGGLPAYDIAESFTVSVANATYTGASAVANNETITLTVTDGANWSVTFTDTQGCTVVYSDTFDFVATCGTACSADAGTPSVSESFVCFNNTIDFAATGFSLAGVTDGYIGLAVSTNPAGAANIGSLSVAALYPTDNTTFTNNGALSFNTEYYLYSFVGSGTPNNFDPSCTDLSDAAGPFVLLQEVTAAQGNYACNGDGTATVNIAVSGGLPAFDASTYNVVVANATLLSGTTATNNGTVTIEVADGDSWNVTLTDNEGCATIIADTFVKDDVCPCSLDISNINVGACNDATGNYTLDVTVVYNNEPLTGGVEVMGQVFATDGSGTQTFSIELPADGATGVNVSATFVDEITCKDVVISAYDAPASCGNTCVVDAGTLTANGVLSLCASEAATTNFIPSGQVLINDIYDYIIVDNASNLVVYFGSSSNVSNTLGAGTYCVHGVAHDGSFSLNVGDSEPSILMGDCFSISACTAATTVSITEGPDASTTAPINTLCNSAAEGTTTLNLSTLVTGDTNGTWSGTGVTANTFNAEGLATGDYTVTYTVTANAPCSDDATSTQTIIVADCSTPDPCEDVTITTNVVTTAVSCNGDTNGAIALTTSGGVAPYTYVWSGGLDAVAIHTNLAAGTYNFTVTDDNGCTASSEAVIDSPDILSVSPIHDCTNGLAISGAGGTEPYSFTVNGGAASIGDVLTNGTYNVMVTDDNGCTATSDLTVDCSVIDPCEDVTISTPNSDITSVCVGDGIDDVVTFSATTPSSTATIAYIITDNTGNILAVLNSNTNNFEGADTDDCFVFAVAYTGILIADNGASITTVTSDACFDVSNDYVTISKVAAPDVATVPPTTIVCNNAADGNSTLDLSILITGDTGGTWSGTGVTGNTFDGSGLTPGSYDLTYAIIDISPCADATSTQTVTVESCASDPCDGLDAGTVALADGATEVALCTGDGIADVVTFSTNNTATSGLYAYIITDLLGNIEAIAINSTFDFEGVTAGFSLVYGVSYSGTLTANIGDNINTLIASGCAELSEAGITIARYQTPDAATIAPSANICNAAADGTSTLDLTTLIAGDTGGTWSGTGVTGNTFDAEGLDEGTYELIYTLIATSPCSDATSTQTVTVEDCGNTVDDCLAFPVAEAGSDIVTCDTSVELQALLPEGLTGFWTVSDSDATIANNTNPNALAVGLNEGINEFVWTITDGADCSSTDTVLLDVAPVITFAVDITEIAECGSTGAVTVSDVQGGSGTGITVSISTFEGAVADPLALSAGVYDIIVSDDLGCSSEQPIALNEPAACLTACDLTISSLGGEAASCGEANGTASVSVAGGSGTYNYIWSDINGTTVAQTLAVSEAANSIEELSAGVYFVLIEDTDSGCDIGATITISNSDSPSLNILSVGATSACGEQDGFVVFSSNGDSFTITNLEDTSITATAGGGTATFNGLPAGTYALSAISTAGCINTQIIVVSEGNTNFNISADVTNTSCGQSDGSISVSFADSADQLNLVWIDDNNNILNFTDNTNPSGLAAGIYTLTASNDSGCTESFNFVIGSVSGPQVSITSTTNVSCAGDTNGAISFAVSGGTVPYTYSIVGTDFTNLPLDNAANTSITNLAAGNYIIQVSDANNCVAFSQIINITQPNALSVVSSTTNISACGLTDGQICLVITGGTAPYTVTDGFGAVIATFNASTAAQCINNLSAGGYDLTIEDANACTFVLDRIDIEEPAACSCCADFALTANSDDASCGANDGRLSAEVTGGSGSFTTIWVNAFTGATVNNILEVGAGTYQVVVTDNDCACAPLTATVVVGEQDGPRILIDAVNNINVCAADALSSLQFTIADGVAPYTYSISNTDISNETLAESAQVNINGLAGGEYIISVSDANGCLASSNMIVIEAPMLLNVNASVINVSQCEVLDAGAICFTIVGETAPYTLVSGDDTFGPIQEGIEFCVTDLAEGSYNFTVEDSNDCSEDLPAFTVLQTADCTVDPCEGVSINDAIAYDCTTGIEVSATGGTPPYTVTSADGTTLNNGDNLADGTYMLTVSDANNCTNTVSVMVDCAVTDPCNGISLVTTATYDCLSGLSLMATGGTPPYSFTVNGNPTGMGDILADGTYDVVVSDNNGCNSLPTALIVDCADPCADFSLTVDTTVSATTCGEDNGVACFTISGGSGAYTISDANNIVTTIEDTQVCISNLAADTYSFTINDGTCTITEEAVIDATVVPGAIQVTTAITDALCEGEGECCFTAFGGAAPYIVSNGEQTITLAENEEGCVALLPGSYLFTVTDQNDCETDTPQILAVLEVPVTIGQANSEISVTASASNIGCGLANSTGSACFNISGGTAPYTITDGNISIAAPEATEVCIDDLAVGTYIYSVTDANACTPSDDVIITIEDNVSSITVADNVTDADCNQANGEICLTITGGTAPYTISSGETFNEGEEACITDLTPSTYNLSIVDAEGCTTTTAVVVGVAGSDFTASIDNVTDADCGENNGSYCVNVSGGSGNYELSANDVLIAAFTNAQNCIDNLDGGTYDIVITDVNTDCSITETVTLLEIGNSITASINPVDAACDSDGEICLSLSGGTAPYIVVFDNGGGTVLPEATEVCIPGFAAGNYSFTATDAEGCSQSNTFVIGSSDGDISISVNAGAAICDELGFACVTITGGNEPYQVNGLGISNALLNGIEQCVPNLAAGNYDITVTDQNGCTAAQTFIIEEEGAATLVQINTTNADCNELGTACITLTGGDAPYTISSATADLNGTLAENDEICFNDLAAGTYEFTVIDNSNCSSVESFVVGGESVNIVASINVINPSCINNDGAICLVISGGTPPYNIEGFGEFNASTPSCITDLAADNYSLILTDQEGCSTIINAVLEEATGCGGTSCDNEVFACIEEGETFNFCPGFCALGDGFVIIAATPGISGTVTLVDGSCILYTPSAGFTGTTTIEVTACVDDICDITNINLSVDGCNDNPTAVDDAFLAQSGQVNCFDVLANDFDIDGNDFSVTAFTQADNGTIVLDEATGELCYTPDDGFNGEDQFTYTICDVDGCDFGIAAITVSGVVVPTPCENPNNPAELCTLPQTDLAVCVEFCNLNASANIQSVATTFGAATTTITNATCFTYSPAAGQAGMDLITIIACDDTGACEEIMIDVVVSLFCTPEPPTVCNNPNNPAEVCTEFETPLQFCVEYCDLGDDALITDIATIFDCGLEWIGSTCVQYTPLPGFVGNDVIEITACDTAGNCEIVAIPVTVVANCDLPSEPVLCENPNNPTDLCTELLQEIEFCVEFCNLNATAAIVDLSTIFDCDLEALPNNCVSYQPLPGFAGNDVIQVVACDNTGACELVNVPITVAESCSTNQPPVALDDSGNTIINQSLILDVTANDVDPDGDDIEITAITQPAFGGTVSILSDSEVLIVPNLNYTGPITFTYTVCDTESNCDEATVNVLVSPSLVNAVNDVAVTDEGVDVEIDVLANDTPTNGLIITGFEQPLLSGVVSYNSDNTALIFAPTTGFVGTVQFEYTVCDGDNNCDTATVTVTINAGETVTAVTDNATTPENTPVIIDVTANDTPAGLSIDSFTQPATGGSVAYNIDNTQLVFTPSTGFTGTSIFTYTACDGSGNCATASVIVTVVADGIDVVAVNDFAATTINNNVIINVLDNDIPSTGLSIDGFTQPVVGGFVTYNSDQTALIFVPNSGYIGTAVFTYTACDDADNCASATVTVSVLDDNVEPCDNPDNLCTTVQTPITFCLQFCTINDINTQITEVNPLFFDCGIEVINDTCVQYTPLPNYIGNETLEVTACNSLGICETVTVNVEVSENCSAAIVATNDNASTDNQTPISIDVLGNDIPSTGLTITDFTQPPVGGSVAYNNDNTALIFTPNSSFVGTAIFTYTTCDSEGNCDVAIVTVIVTQGNVEPCDNPTDLCTTIQTPIEVCLQFCTLNETAAIQDLDPLFFDCGLEIDNDTCFVYTPLPGFIGNETIQVTACDNTGNCEVVFVNIEVAESCDDPAEVTANNDNEETDNQTPISIDVLFNDIPSTGLTITSFTQPPVGGTVSLIGNELLFTPSTNFVGTAIFTYEACDSEGNCDTAVVTVIVNDGDDPEPCINPDNLCTELQQPLVFCVEFCDLNETATITDIDPLFFDCGINNLGDNCVQYVPLPGFIGNEILQIIGCDNTGLCDTVFVNIAVQVSCDEPVVVNAVNDTFTNVLNTSSTSLDVLGNDTPLSFVELTSVTQPIEGGTVAIVGGEIIFTPTPGYEGIVIFTYTICHVDDPTNCDTATVTVNVTGIPNVVNAIDDTANTEEGVAISINVLANDLPLGSVVITDFETSPFGGTVTQVGNELVFTPNDGFSGVAVFTYTICSIENPDDCDTATVTVTVEDCSFQTEYCTEPLTPVTICVEFCSLNETAAVVDVSPTFDCGIQELDALCFIYTPIPGYFGLDPVMVEGCDDTGACETVIINVTVQEDCDEMPEGPVAINDNYTTCNDAPLEMVVGINDVSDIAFELTSVDLAIEGGTLSVISTVGNAATILFEPDGAFEGIISFDYQICNTATPPMCDQATVTINVVDCSICDPDDINDFICAEPLEQSIYCPQFCDFQDGDTPYTIIDIDATFNCSLTVENDTCIGYTPLPGYTGQDSLTIVACATIGGIVDSTFCDTVVIYTFVACAAPIANDDIFEVPGNLTSNLDILVNDLGVCAGDEYSLTIIGDPSNGAAFVDENQNVDYTPSTGFSGTDEFVYQICEVCEDGTEECDQATVTIEVVPPVIEDPIDAQPDIVQTPFETPITISVLENDIGNGISIVSATTPLNGGEVIVNADGTITYVPMGGFTGVDYFFYTIVDVNGQTATTIVSVTVLGEDAPNQPPTANNDIISTDVDTPVTIPVLVNDSDPEGGTLTITDVTDPANGTVTINPTDGTITYTPDPGFTGTDTFTYTICDDGVPQECDEAVVVVDVGLEEPSNNPPLAIDDLEITTEVGEPVTIDVLENDTDPDGDNLIITTVTQPINGVVTLNDDSTEVIYTPNSGFEGIDYFTYVVCDDGIPSLCDTAYVSVIVGAGTPLEAVNDTVCTSFETPIDIGVLMNDINPSGSMLEITIVTEAQNGISSVAGAGLTIAYIPDLGFSGIDSVVYEICELPTGDCDTATVIIFVDPLLSANPDVFYVTTGTTVMLDVLANDDAQFPGIISIDGAEDGTAAIVGNMIEYTPNDGFLGTDYVEYTITDCAGAIDTGYAAIVVISDTINLPPVAVNDVFEVPNDEPVIVDVLGNDFDPNGDPIIITDILDPSPIGGTVEVNEDSTAIVFTPDSGYVGCFEFAYIICDNGEPPLCDTAFVVLSVGTDSCVNNPPIAMEDVYTITTDEVTNLPVTVNDTDPDGDNIIITQVFEPACEGSTTTIAADSISIDYIPGEGCEEDVFTYIICDDGNPSLCDTALVIINFGLADIDAEPDIDVTTIDTPVTIDVIDNDIGEGITVTDIITQPINGGTVVIDDEGTIIYTPVPGLGDYIDYFEYEITDENGQTDITLVTVIVLPEDSTNVPPTAVNDQVLYEAGDEEVCIDVLANDFDLFGGDEISLVLPPGTPNPDDAGAISVINDSEICFTPANDSICELVTLEYTIIDNGEPALTDQGIVAFVCESDSVQLNNPPVAFDDNYVTEVNTPISVDVFTDGPNDDFDPDGDNFILTFFSEPLGTLTPIVDGQFEYEPPVDFVGTDFFTYIICDVTPVPLCDTAYVTIVIQPAITEVDANPDIVYTDIDTPIDIDVTVNDTPESTEECPLTVSIVTLPANGVVEITDTENNIITYTPNAGFTGTDVFLYELTDCNGVSDITLVTVIVQPNNVPPVAIPDIETIACDELGGALADTVCINVLNNDFDSFGGDNITIVNFEQGTTGTVELGDGVGELCYIPDETFDSLDSFEYVICDNGDPIACDTTTVTIQCDIIPVNNPPIAVVDSLSSLSCTAPFNIDVLANDTDPDGDDLVSVGVPDLFEPGCGTVSVDGLELLFDPSGCADGDIVFIPYFVCDAGTPSLCDTSFVVLTIDCEVVEVIANPDIVFTAPETDVIIPILDNDEGPVDVTSVTILEEPELGTSVIDPVTGEITYTPNPGVTDTTDYLIYEICNLDGTACDSTLVTIIILPEDSLNVPPVAVNDQIVFDPAEPGEEPETICIDVLANDFDPFCDEGISIVSFTLPENGLVFFDAELNQMCYTPEDDFCGVDVFTYTITDNCPDGPLEATGTVAIFCSDDPENTPNNAPVAVNDEVCLEDVDQSIAIELLANDTDPDGDNLIVTFISAPCGTAELIGSVVEYTHNPTCGETDYFSYIICDDGLPSFCDTAYVYISFCDTVPVIADIFEETPEDTPVSICVDDYLILADYDLIDIVDIQVLSLPENGSVVVDTLTDSCFVYIPNPDFCGIDVFELILTDSESTTVTIVVQIDVICVPDAPIAVDDAFTLCSDSTNITLNILENDTDVDEGDVLTIIDIAEAPINGSVEIVGDSSIIYTPNEGFTEGCDSLSYIVEDSFGLIDTGLVVVCLENCDTLNIVDAVDDETTIGQNETVNIPILDNDTFPDVSDEDVIISVEIVQDPVNGTVIVINEGDGTFSVDYTPNEGCIEVDSFQYELCAEFIETGEILCDTAWVNITQECEVDCELILAQGFSPNGDGVNDDYLISNLENIEECFPGFEPELIVFNRWGDVVYRNENYSNSNPWNGTWFTSGQPVDDGTYFYCLTINPEDENTIYRGFIELRR